MSVSNKKIAVVGTGVIGASWAACFLANGFDVAATDPAPGAEGRLKALVDAYWPALERIGLVEGATRSRLSFHENLDEAVADAFLVQENGPERVDIKRTTMAQISAAAPANALPPSTRNVC